MSNLDTALPTYAVFARFNVTAPSEREAIERVVEQLTAHEEPFHEISAERQEPDGTWMIVARFVLVSVDGHTAVLGLDETLREAGLLPDEVWAGAQVS